VDLRRAELERAFRKYGGARGVTVLVPKNSTFAFVEMESERQADLALQQMVSQYRVNRARRTRHEALQEERAAAEAGKMGKKKENVEWD
jgi:RNA recognition motif-containing protein